MANTNQNKSLSDILTDTETNVNPVERLISATVGGALLAYGLKKGGVLGTLLSVAGGGIALRGVTGHCQVYGAMGIDRSEPGSAGNIAAPGRSSKKSDTWNNSALSGKVHVTKSLTINKSPAELYSFWHNFENFAEVYGTSRISQNYRAIKLRTGKPKRRSVNRSNGMPKRPATSKTRASAGARFPAQTFRIQASSSSADIESRHRSESRDDL
jgi:hypothetical protein